jgi:hypothetical protein
MHPLYLFHHYYHLHLANADSETESLVYVVLDEEGYFPNYCPVFFPNSSGFIPSFLPSTGQSTGIASMLVSIIFK